MNVSRAEDPKDGFVFSCVGCKKTKSVTNSSRSTRFTQSKRKSGYKRKELYNPTEERPHLKKNLRFIVLDPCVVKAEIGVLRESRDLRRGKCSLIRARGEWSRVDRRRVEACQALPSDLIACNNIAI